MPKEIVLVAGCNYPRYHESGDGRSWVLSRLAPGPWRQYCLRLAQDRLKNDPKLTITLFDFLQGTQESLALVRGTVAGTLVFSPPRPIEPKNYRWVKVSDKRNPDTHQLLRPPATIAKSTYKDHPRILYFTGLTQAQDGLPAEIRLGDYKDSFYGDDSLNEEHSLSITDVYDYIRSIGRDRPSTLAELHFFAHAYPRGPILVNTGDVLRHPRKRDPLDKDCRVKDFDPPNPEFEELQEWDAAFAMGARIFLWGCSVESFAKQLTLSTLRQKKKIPPGKSGDKLLTFTYTADWGTEKEFHDKLGGSGKSSDKKSLDDIKGILFQEADRIYAQKLANATGIKVAGALPGTSSNYDSAGPVAHRFLHVLMGAISGDDEKSDYTSVLGLYRDLLNVDFDLTQLPMHKKLGRGFALYPVSSP